MDHGLDIDGKAAAGPDGDSTPLVFAIRGLVQRKSQEVITELLKHQPSLQSLRDMNGCENLACLPRKVKEKKLTRDSANDILQYAGILATPYDDHIFQVLQEESLEELKNISNINATINLFNDELLTPLLFVVDKKPVDWFDKVKYLINMGANITAADPDGLNILHLATRTLSPQEFYNLACYIDDIGETQVFVGHTKGSYKTMVMSILQMIVYNQEPLLETLQLLHKHGADFNELTSNHAQGRRGDNRFSLYDLAINARRTVNCLHWITKLGGNWNIEACGDCRSSFSSSGGGNLLHAAITAVNTEALNHFLELGLDVNKRDKSGSTPLLLILSLVNKDERYPLVEAILKYQPNLYAQNKQGLSALELAIRGVRRNYGWTSGSESQAEDPTVALLKTAAGVGEVGGASLFDAIRKGNLSDVEDACNNLTTFNIVKSNTDLSTPLFYTIYVRPRSKNWLEKLQLLITKGANVTMRNVKGDSILSFAVGQLNGTQFEQLATYLVHINQTALFHIRNGQGRSLLQEYVKKVKPPLNTTLELFWSVGLDFNDAAETAGESVATWLVRARPSMDILKLLHDFGANLKLLNSQNESLIHFAAEKGHLDMIEFLVSDGLDINIKNGEGLTPLCLVIQSSQIWTSVKHELVEKLLELGADDDVTIFGVSLVTWAERKVFTGVIESRTVELLRARLKGRNNSGEQVEISA